MILALALAAATPDFAALRAIDLRLTTIGHRLAVANLPLCRETAPQTGLVLHAIDQYERAARAAARGAFRFAEAVSVEAVVPGSAADRGGVRADDGVIAIDGVALGAAGEATGSATRDAALARVDALTPTAPVRVTIRRDGAVREIVVPASPGCRSTFDLADAADEAFSDGASVRIGIGYMARWTDDQIAVLVAHELAHNVLRHRARLTAAKVDMGIGAEFGRNRTLIRRTEDEADRLSVHLLRNAGHDPQIAVRFWRDEGPKADGGLFRSRVYRSAKDRAAAIAAEVAAIPSEAGVPYAPPVLATRDEILR